jgi:starvation-inducible DNA-binding protein
MTTPAKAKPMSREVTAALQQALVDLIALSLLSKQFHWNVAGPLFRPLHEMFDEFTEAYRGWYDDVAERLLAVGTTADGRTATVARTSGVEEVPAGPVRDRVAVGQFLKRLESVGARLQERLEALGQHDPVTQDLVIGVLEGLEKQAWMLRAQQS